MTQEALLYCNSRRVSALWHNIHLLHAGEGNVKIYSTKSIIFPEGNAQGEYDTRGW